ncbi:c-type cytochrome [Cereibacter johrii]|uniref:Cytochrome c n=1 Tax=Cereibacter johrii TaxID=445629 RepID=A0ABX5J9U5_9RHOB|nr:cytochrome c family protein [Cereibacter johrii]QCP86442.1 cytochrome c family protein [Cereibacter sphaeroides]MEA5159877.1 cytochrome c family protein [Cereibacter johrii]ODM42452.1 cytochrome C [Cereibacter johrii]PTM79164.1 cytochrome c [Cereibacter johrii]RAZ86416.1 cytochrome c family protein [Cereibacter johrii]
MFDTMTLTKAVGAGCGALLVFLLGSWAASGLYTFGEGHGEDVTQAYVIETGDGGASEEPAAEAVPFPELVAAADAAAGQKVFAKCAACHKLDGSDATGPHLNGVVDRAVASVAGFAYSDAMVAHAAEAPTWTLEELGAFVENPKGHVPGTKMTFAGLPKEQDRANVVAYLASLQ